MSVFLSAVTAVVTTPLPVATPVVVTNTVEVIKTVPAVSPELMKGAQVLLLLLSGIGASIFHQIIEAVFSKREGGWKATTNIALTFAFGLLIAALSAFVTGDLHLTYASGLDFLTTVLIVLGSSQGRYAFKKFVDSLGTDEVESVPAVVVPEVVAPAKAAV